MKIDGIREEVVKQKGADPLVEIESWELINNHIPEEYWQYFLMRDGAARFVDNLPRSFSLDKFAENTDGQAAWVKIGNFYRNLGHAHQAFDVYLSLHEHLCASQEKTGKRAHKGEILVWMSDCCHMLGYRAIKKRYLMLSLCEDAISLEGSVPPETTGTYFRLVWGGGLTDADLNQYAKDIYKYSEDNPNETLYPEWILQQLDQYWMVEFPEPIEAPVYVTNRTYIKYLMFKLGEGEGRNLELLADYVLSCMPGCRTYRRHKAKSTDYDIVCSVEGFNLDFRSELGRYFVCECKDWKKPADFTTMAKFCRVLDSTKSRFGILFSKSGISGEGDTKYAEREQLKIFQDRGMVIIVVTEEDLRRIVNGENFISMLRAKYEKVRLDLSKE